MAEEMLWSRFAKLPLTHHEKGCIYAEIQDANLEKLKKLLPDFLEDETVASSLRKRYMKEEAPSQFVNPILPDTYKQQLDDYIEGRIYLPRFKKNGVDLPCFCSRPSLLLHQLDAQDTSRFESFLEKSTRFSLVYGTSGAGKTRILYSYLSKNFGLFFVCNELGNGGSSDFREMIQRIKPLMRKDDPSRNASVVTFAVTLLLLARLQIFSYCKSKGITTEGWLVLQAACHYLEDMGSSVDLDIFHLYYKEILEQNNGVFSLPNVDLLNEILKAQRATANLVAGTEAPIIVVDEAQVICTLHPDYGPFQSDQPDIHTREYEQRPLAKPVLDSFYNTIQQHRVLFTGTGLTLTFKRHEISSPVAKAVTNDSQYSEFGGWVVAEEMVKYAQNILKIDGCTERIIKEKIFPWFRGRFRPFVTLVEETLIRGEDIGNVWQDMKECLTTARVLPGIHKSLYAQVDALLKNSRGNLDTVTNHEVTDLLLRATVQYFYFGRPLELNRGRK